MDDWVLGIIEILGLCVETGLLFPLNVFFTNRVIRILPLKGVNLVEKPNSNLQYDSDSIEEVAY